MSQRVLVVDDEAHIVQVVSLKLRNAGYEVITGVDGEEGYEIACRENPDLIITDYQMPYMTGLEFCQQLARNPQTADIPVLMLTARGYALDDEDLIIGNIKDVLSKPFSPRMIVAQVNKLLSADDEVPGGDESRSTKTNDDTDGVSKTIRPEAA